MVNVNIEKGRLLFFYIQTCINDPSLHADELSLAITSSSLDMHSRLRLPTHDSRLSHLTSVRQISNPYPITGGRGIRYKQGSD